MVEQPSIAVEDPVPIPSDLDACSPVAEKVLSGERLTKADGLALYALPLFTLGALADRRRAELHPGPEATFVVDRVISYTNACNVYCKFCAFYRPPRHREAYLLSDEEIFRKIGELVALGGTQVLFQGGVNPDLGLEYYTRIFREIKRRFPVHLHSLSAVEIDFVARKEGLSLAATIRALKDAGLDSLPGAGAEMLVDRVRKEIAPLKISAAKWLEVMETAHRAGLFTSATMMYGSVETLEERIDHLLLIRDLQDRTEGFSAFIPWSFSPPNTQFDHLPPATGLDYLRTIAVSRLILDNVPHLQSGWLTEGHKMAQAALAFGADDMGGILIEDQVLGATGLPVDSSIRRMVHLIREAGKVPVQRNTRYEWVKPYGARPGNAGRLEEGVLEGVGECS